MNMLLLRAHPEWNERAVQWFHEKWRVPAEAYRESILACQQPGCVVPQWYLVLDDSGEIAAGIGVIENDFHKRRDLSPNVCAVYVEPAHRGHGIARVYARFCLPRPRRIRRKNSIPSHRPHRLLRKMRLVVPVHGRGRRRWVYKGISEGAGIIFRRAGARLFCCAPPTGTSLPVLISGA